jgi:hypothetical protein
MLVNITKPYPPDVLFLDAYNCFTPVDTSLSIAIGQKDWATARHAAEKLCEMTKIVPLHAIAFDHDRMQSAPSPKSRRGIFVPKSSHRRTSTGLDREVEVVPVRPTVPLGVESSPDATD